jgi:glycosyltransferase involved in cell wall biosynthesis
MTSSLRYGQSWLTARFADAHIVPSMLCGDFLVREFGVCRETIHVIPPLVPDAYLTTPEPAMSPTRLQRVLCVGRIVADKDPVAISQAVVDLLSLESGASFTWITDGALPHEVREILKPVAERVSVEGWRKRVDLIRAYDAHGLLLMPSMFDGFGRVAIEAMARGMCVIVSSESGISTIIKDGQSGFVTAPGDVDMVVRASRRVMNDPLYAQQTATRAREVAMAHRFETVWPIAASLYRELSGA